MGFIASGLLTASHRNYPGGEALERLLQQHIPMHFVEHEEAHLPMSPQFKPTFVHIDAAAAMTGVTRYTILVAFCFSQCFVGNAFVPLSNRTSKCPLVILLNVPLTIIAIHFLL